MSSIFDLRPPRPQPDRTRHNPAPPNFPQSETETRYFSPQPESTRAHRPGARTRRYAHMVQESLTSRFAKFICSFFLSLLFVVGLILFILYLNLRPHRPRFYLNSFTLNQAGSASFNVSDRNPNQKIGIYYNDMSGSLYYFDQVIASGTVMHSFYQEPKSTTNIEAQLAGKGNGPVLSQISGNQSTGESQLRLELLSTIRFKVKTWDTHEHKMHVSCELAAGADGNLLPRYVGERCDIYF